MLQDVEIGGAWLDGFNVAEATLPRKSGPLPVDGDVRAWLQCSRGNVASEMMDEYDVQLDRAMLQCSRGNVASEIRWKLGSLSLI